MRPMTILKLMLLAYYNSLGNWDGEVGTANGYGLDDREVGVRAPVGARYFSLPRRPGRFWGPPNLLSNGYRGIFTQG
jgi:hypothetical protein